MSVKRILAINPGSTSTKIALFEGEEKVFSANVSHEAAVLAQYKDISDQLPYRTQTILDVLAEKEIGLAGMDAFVARGGGLLPLEGGTYEIDALILEHARTSANGVVHPAQLGSQIADRLRTEFGGRAFVVNPPDVDEYQDVARVTGCKDIVRASHLHALNQKETAIRHAEQVLGKRYEDCNFVVCHIGGGVSVAAHRGGKMVDGNDIVEGEGPMAPTRMGAVPAAPLIRLCFSGKYTEKELLTKCTKSGGFVDHLGTSDAIEVVQRAKDGDAQAKLVWQAFIYQIEKAIGEMAVVLHGKIDGILLGGGIVHNEDMVQSIKDHCGFLAPVTAYPGEFEMEALASGALRVLEGRETAKTYLGDKYVKG